MTQKFRVWTVGFALWMTPMWAFQMGRSVSEGGSLWLLGPIAFLAIGFHALLDWYVHERYLLDLTEHREG